MNRPALTPPRSPFATHLSGSARETELRIRNIFQWKKKRPPVWLMILMGAIILLCGSLVSCQRQTQAQDISLTMDVQYYDDKENYIEIPALTGSGEGAAAINEALAGLKADYQPVLEGSDPSARETHCLLYPAETERYLSLVFFRTEYRTDLVTGHVTTLVYDKETERQVTLPEALELAGQTEEGLCEALAVQFDPVLEQDNPGAHMCIQNQALEGFRMGSEGQPVFYLTARTDDRDDSVSDTVSGWEDLYIWQGGRFTRYDQYNVTELQPLVPAEECLDLEPPLWRQWYFAGGQPEEQNTAPSSGVWSALLDGLDLSALDDRDGLGYIFLSSAPGDGYTLAALCVKDFYPRYILAIGAVDNATGQLLGPVFEARGSGAYPFCRAVLRQDGTPALLYAANSTQHGLSQGEAGLVSLDRTALSWSWPVEGDILQEGSQARADYSAYWDSRLALPSPGGMDVFVRTGNTVVNGDGPQWVPDHNQQFYAVPEDRLTAGIYYQVRTWLEEFTREQYNPWNSRNASAVWQIVSLTPEDGVYRERNFEGQVCYNLVARADNGQDLYLNASVLYDHGSGRVAGVSRCVMGTGGELAAADFTGLTADDASRDILIRTCLETSMDVPQWYYLEELPDNSIEGAMSVDAVTPIDSGETDGQRWTLFALDFGLYYSDGAPLRLSWHGGINHTYIRLAQDQNGSYTRVLDFGSDIADPPDTQPAGSLLNEQVCLCRDGFSTPVGPGVSLSFSCLDTMSIEEERLTDYEPIYHSGDYWFRSSGQVGGETFTTLSYHDSIANRDTIHTLDTTMTDLHTPQGIRVGDSRAEVLEAYPTAVAGNYWGKYPDADMLYYIPGLDPEQSDGFYDELGPAILFFFEGDTLSQITLTNMFN